MKKVLTLTVILAAVLTCLLARPGGSTAQRSMQDELLRRKAAAAESKPRKAAPADALSPEQMKAAARADKGVRQAPDAPSLAAPSDDPLAQSSKHQRGKAVPQGEFGRSLEVSQAFDSLREKALAVGTVRVIVGLAADFEPEGELPSAASVQSQRRGISVAQDELLKRLPVASRGSAKRFETVPYVALEVDAEGLSALRSSPEVTNVVEDVAVAPTLAESVSLVGANNAWAAGFSGAGQTVAILDTGVDKNHPFLAGKVVSEACFSTTNGPAGSTSVCPGGVSQSTSANSGLHCSALVNGCDHGTHVAGIAAGKGASFSGVARDANVIAIQVFSRFDSQANCGDTPAPCVRTFTSDQMLGLERVFALRSTFNIAAANMSLGGGQNSSNCDGDMRKPIIDNLRSAGIATVIASGNSGFKSALGAPACISSAVSVGSTNDGSRGTLQDSVSDFSNSASFLSLLAPGMWINSSVPGGGFDNFPGTSMAAPHVAGAWAVLKSKSPSVTVTQALNALKDTGRLVTDVNGITKPRIRVDAAVNALGGGVGGCGSPAPISTGQTVTGSLSSTDCRFPADGGRFADAYTFSGTAGQQIAVSMSSPAFDTLLHLLGPSGAEVASNDDGGGGTNSRIPATSGFFTLPSSGTYTIQATSFSTGTEGSYTLSLMAQTPDGCATITPIAFGQSLGGALSNTDCRFSDGSFFDKYSFTGTAGQQVTISMSSSAFDTFLILLRPDGTGLASDDDGGGGTNSRIPASSGTITLPTSGTYTIFANSFSASVTGGYTLTLTGQTPGGACPSSSISLGQTVNGTLSSTDCRLSDDSFFDSYTFSGTAGQRVAVSMSSATFDTYLLLLTPDGAVFAEDDDGGGGLNSRIPATSGTITLPVNGTYRILANSFSAGVTGGYSLTLTGSAVVSCPSSAIAFGQSVNGALASTDCQFTDGSFFDSYTFSGTAGQRIAVSMSSLAFDTFLLMSGPNGLVVDDDDGGGGLNSRIPAGTGFFTLPTTGTYNIFANSFASGVTGGYTLSLTSSQAGCTYAIGSPGGSFPFGGGPGSVGVTAGTGCGWNAVSNAGWLTVSSGASGSGSGSVGFSVAANTTPEARTGTLTVAGLPFTVTQAANTASSVQLGAAAQSVSEAARKVVFTVTRTGNTTAPASVGYATSDGTADRRKDYTQTLGTLNFAAGETSKTVTVFIADDTLLEPAETFTFALSNASGATLGTPASAVVTVNSDDAVTGPNPVGEAAFNTEFFVSQHYVDFFSREADAPGLAFWMGVANGCGATDLLVCRINVSGAFFLSIEFQQTGYLVERMYKAAYGDATGTSTFGGPHQLAVPIIRLEEFLPDTQRIGSGVVVHQPGWEALLEANKVAFTQEFVQRQRFTNAFPATMTPTQFVDQLNARAGNPLNASERQALINELAANNTTAGRASVLRKVAEDPTLEAAEKNRAFVLMQFFGYLRRNPNDAPDVDYTGYDFWLGNLERFNGNFVQAELVKAFLSSTEYRLRFGP